jgi:hypothetical protein
MDPLHFSIRRVVDWVRALDSKETGYYPLKTNSKSDDDVDRLIHSRLALFNLGLLQLRHDSMMSVTKLPDVLVKPTELPEELLWVYLTFVRSMFAGKSGIRKEWMDRLYTIEKPEWGWPRLLFRIGLMHAAKGEKFHNDSWLGNYFVELLKNQREYSAYKADLEKQLSAGKSVHILSPVDYFKSRGRTANSDSSDSDGGSSPGRPLKRKAVVMER